MCWCKINVTEMERSLDFYTKVLGLPLERRFQPVPGTEIAFLEGGGAKIELIVTKDQQPAKNIEGLSIGFQVEKIENTLNAVRKKGIQPETDILRPNAATAFFYLRDPDGVQIQLVELK